jgi:antitoxin (DNA-binding transcriptional repressor) of toxin-antitoxin stability system
MQTPQTKTVDVHDAEGQLANLVALAVSGTEVVLTDGTIPLARLVPVPKSGAPRVPGLHPGAIQIAEDFDEPLPDDFWTGGS